MGLNDRVKRLEAATNPEPRVRITLRHAHEPPLDPPADEVIRLRLHWGGNEGEGADNE
jgi:hypothetical protein